MGFNHRRREHGSDWESDLRWFRVGVWRFVRGAILREEPRFWCRPPLLAPSLAAGRDWFWSDPLLWCRDFKADDWIQKG